MNSSTDHMPLNGTITGSTLVLDAMFFSKVAATPVRVGRVGQRSSALRDHEPSTLSKNWEIIRRIRCSLCKPRSRDGRRGIVLHDFSAGMGMHRHKQSCQRSNLISLRVDMISSL